MPKPSTLLALSTIGCSAKVDVTSESAASTTKTSVDVDLFQTKPDSPSQEKRQGNQIVIGNGNSVITVKHLHFHHDNDCPETTAIMESHQAECERLSKEHLKRVAEWHEMIRD